MVVAWCIRVLALAIVFVRMFGKKSFFLVEVIAFGIRFTSARPIERMFRREVLKGQKKKVSHLWSARPHKLSDIHKLRHLQYKSLEPTQSELPKQSGTERDKLSHRSTVGSSQHRSTTVVEAAGLSPEQLTVCLALDSQHPSRPLFWM